ncbi:hypothetical protein [Singulisphaera sp. PoT]|uniref:hypothetical protein n=1 Tax=Singulisphaera sp. PoT TaxID=3411797 RepID=UPI003BF5E386
MGEDAVLETLFFVLLVTAITVLPFVFLLVGVMILKWLMGRNKRSSGRDDN